MRDLHKEFLHRKIKKPSKLVAWPVLLVFNIISRRHNTRFIYDESFQKYRKKQMLILCQHRSKNDYIYTFAGLKSTNVHILCGYQNIFQPVVYTLLKRLGVIAKMLYQPDAHATKQIFRAKKLGGSIMVFPEGIQSTSGSTHPINPATMKLIMKLRLPVALVTLKGSYFTRTRYCADNKKGQIEVGYSMLFEPEDFDEYTQEQLYERMLERFSYNEFLEHSGEKIAFRGKKPNISGLDNIIYKCPACEAEHYFSVENDRMRCAACGFEISMNEYYDISATCGELRFSNIDEWFKWQRKMVAKEILSDDFSLCSRVLIGRINTKRLHKNYSLQYYGEGILTLTNKGLTYKGIADREETVIEFSPQSVYSLTMSLQYDLDLYYQGKYYNFKLLENEKQVIKWTIAAEEIHNLYDTAWRTVSSEVY